MTPGEIVGDNGTIARVLVWNRVLSAAEVTQLDNGLKAFFSLP